MEAFMLQVTDVGVVKGRRAVLKDVNLTADSRTIVALLGPSGCGKTSLVRVLAGLERPDRGTITLEGHAIDEVLRHGQIGYVQQNPILLPWLTARKNATLLKDCRDGFDSDGISTLARLVALDEHVLDQQPRTLSGGQMQRIALIRALALEPRLLLLDESFASVDAALKASLIPQLRNRLLGARSNTTVTIVVSHDMADCLLFSDSIYGHVEATENHETTMSTFVKIHDVGLPSDREGLGIDSDAFVAELREVNRKILDCTKEARGQ
jgi:ABC-type nitrate/sulfonate/bicarbonate transport system ATPase subunit